MSARPDSGKKGIDMADRRPGDKDIFTSIDRVLREFEPDGCSRVKSCAARFLRAATAVTGKFLEHKCPLRASALSFTTILSIVPFLALAFAILKGFGVQNALEPLVIKHLSAGSGDVVDRIISYINNTKMASLGAIGLAALIVTVISLLGSIEDAFNEIWGVEETRSIYRKFSDYLSVVVSGPILLLAALSVTTTLQSQKLVRWLMETAYFGDLLLFSFRIIPYVSIWLALVCMFSFIPNTKVKITSALFGGVLAGTAWQIAQWGYVHFQIGVAKYNAIYGTLAVLPIFMVWIYTSWLIVLFGVELVVAHQSRNTFLHDFEPARLSFATREATALLILLVVADAFYRKEKPWTVERLSKERGLPPRTVRKILSKMATAGYLVVEEGKQAYYPAQALEHARIDSFLKDIRSEGKEFPLQASDRLGEMARGLIARIEAGAVTSLEGLTLKDLMQRLSAGDDPPLSEDNTGATHPTV